MPARILVIDDDASLLELIAYLLRKDGYDVDCAAEPEAALELALANQPTLVISDIVMPGRGGLDTIMEIKRQTPAVRIIAMSGAVGVEGDGFLRMASLVGADEVLRKPFRPAVLSELVVKLLGR